MTETGLVVGGGEHTGRGRDACSTARAGADSRQFCSRGGSNRGYSTPSCSRYVS